MSDIETAQRLVEQSNGAPHIVSTWQLDHRRDRFADALPGKGNFQTNHVPDRPDCSLSGWLRYGMSVTRCVRPGGVGSHSRLGWGVDRCDKESASQAVAG